MFTFFVTDVDPSNVGSVDYEQFLEISKSTEGIFVFNVFMKTRHQSIGYLLSLPHLL